MFSKTNKNAQTMTRPSPSIIGNDCSLTGEVDSSGDIHVDGRINGNISCNKLVIGEKGEVHGDVKAETTIVIGTIIGDITSSLVEVAATGKIVGNTTHDTISVESGAYINGQCNHISHNDKLLTDLSGTSQEDIVEIIQNAEILA